MDPIPLSSECLEQQRRLWLRLAESLEQSQEALLQGQVTRFERCTEEQQKCCDQLHALGPTWNRDDVLATEIRQLQLRVRHLNRVYAALLRRATRSLVILRNLLNGPHCSYDTTVAVRARSALGKG